MMMMMMMMMMVVLFDRSISLARLVHKNYERILTKFCGGFGLGPRSRWLDSGDDMDSVMHFGSLFQDSLPLLR